MDKDFIEKIRNGDVETLEALYNRYRSEFLFFLKKYNIDRDDCLDIYQESVIALYQNAQKGKLENLKSSLKTYLFAIGKYKAIEQFKMTKINETSIEQVSLDHLKTHIPEEDLPPRVLAIKYYLNKLGKTCKDVLTLFYYEEKKLNEIAYLLNYKNSDVVKNQKARCVKKLKSLIHNN